MLAGSIGAVCTVVAISIGLATGGGALGATSPSPAPSTAAMIAAIVPQPEATVSSSIVAADGASSGPVTGGTAVTVTGADLGGVASVSFGGNPGKVVSVTDDTVTITTPPAIGLATGTVPVELFDIHGRDVKVTAPAPVGPADAPPPLSGTAAAAAAADAAPADPVLTAPVSLIPASVTPLTFSYVPDPHITAQIDYALAHWNNYNRAYGVIPGNDCVNFASQSLIARGWAMDGEWSFNAGTRQSSAAWDSSTAFAAYLAAHPERATPLTDDQRAQVKVGDVVQFDWNSSGDRDHTGIVTRVDKSAGGVAIYYAGHTSNTIYKSVDESLANAGGTVSYWSIT